VRVVVHFAIGLIFGLGLVIAGMADPAKVLNFLDVAAIATGTWDASLAFVMGGAVVVTFIGYRLAWRRPTPLMDTRFHHPTQTQIDARVIIGPVIFGVGWGLSGFCPGPAFTALAYGGLPALIFVAAMAVGMVAARWQAIGVAHVRA
jgi:uncharacterized protein